MDYFEKSKKQLVNDEGLSRKDILKKTELDLKGLVFNDEQKSGAESIVMQYLTMYSRAKAIGCDENQARAAAFECLRAMFAGNK